MKYTRKYEQLFTFNKNTRSRIFKGKYGSVEFEWREGDIGYYHTHPGSPKPSTLDILMLDSIRYMVIQGGRWYNWIDMEETPHVIPLIKKYKRLRKPHNKRMMMRRIKKELKIHQCTKMPDFVPAEE